MTTGIVAIIVTVAIFGLTHTALLVRWGTRLQSLVESHDRSLYAEPNGLHRWRHDVVTPRLYQLDDLVERDRENEKEHRERDA